MKQLVLASSNEGKIREIRRILAPLDIEVIPQAHFQVSEADEPHGTFMENALAKARHAATLTGLPALADDSGICVDALDGAPGVYSARFAGEPKWMSATTTACSSCSRTGTTGAHITIASSFWCVMRTIRSR